MEAGFMAVLLSGGVALALGLAFGVLHVAVHAMSAVDGSPASREGRQARPGMPVSTLPAA